jgi:hypothetical protein
VNVNLILGNPFLQATNMVIDYSDKVAECRALDCPPFPIEFRRAQLTAPTPPAAPTALAQLSDVKKSKVAIIERVEAFVASAYPASSDTRKRKVKFTAPTVEPIPAHYQQIDLQGGFHNFSPREALTDVLEPAGESRNEFGAASE